MRADKYLAEKFGSRTKAADALKRGLVLRGRKPLSPDDNIEEGDQLEFLKPEEQYVSNGGYKLARGLDRFGESVRDEVFADLGASTGGFCDCLLQRGAKHVYCIDVGENQLDPRLSADRRVTVMDRTNARYLEPQNFPEALDGVVSDLSFISLKLVIPAIEYILPVGGRAFLLFKPQFECEGVGIGKNGIVPVLRHAALLDSFYTFLLSGSLAPLDIVNAPVRDKKNIEYIIFLKKGATAIKRNEFLNRANNFLEKI